jgi:uncharacterized protein YdeI (YjbR/CyaY-like superfamily)
MADLASRPELEFSTRAGFRAWLEQNGATSGGVWLVFGKTNAVVTLSASDALEEALCFGWIDGQMRSIDQTRYLKYFAPRRAKSVWSQKNRALVATLRDQGLMARAGEDAVDSAKKAGTWDSPKAEPVTDSQVADFEAKLAGISPAQENFAAMPPSVRRTYTRRYRSFKTEEARERDFARIVERLNNNLKPM